MFSGTTCFKRCSARRVVAIRSLYTPKWRAVKDHYRMRQIKGDDWVVEHVESGTQMDRGKRADMFQVWDGLQGKPFDWSQKLGVLCA